MQESGIVEVEKYLTVPSADVILHALEWEYGMTEYVLLHMTS